MTETRYAAHSTHPYLPLSQSWIYNQLIHLEKYKPFVFTKRLENLDTFPLDEVYALYTRPWYDVGWQKLSHAVKGYFPFAEELIREKRACLLHSHSGPYGRQDYRLAQAVHVPHIVSFYGSDIWLEATHTDYREDYERMFEASDLFLVEGNAMRAQVIALGCAPEKVRVHHLGVPPERITFTPRRIGPDGEIRFLMAGRAIEKKGHLFGLLAFAELASEHPEARLLIMTWGSYDDTATNIQKLKDIVTAHHLEDRVEIIGQKSYDEYLSITRSCHIVLNPSVHAENGDAEGGFPVTITELLASGMPVVASTHCDIPEIVKEGESGFLAPERDVEALAAKMDLMIRSADRWPEMGKTGRKTVEAEYNVHTQSRRLEEFYDSLTAR